MKTRKMPESETESPPLTESEKSLIELVVDFGRMIGLQKSVCEIYGLLFASFEPLSMEKISKKLQISLGSTSQGLKVLKDLGAVKTLYVVGQRKDFYEGDEMRPRLNATEVRLKEIQDSLEKSDSEYRDQMAERVDLIRKLNNRAKRIVPAVSTVLKI